MGFYSSFFWWRLELLLLPQLEESLLWKLESLGIHRYAVQFLPNNPSKRTLLVWLPADIWSKKEREKLVEALIPLAENLELTLPSHVWEKVDDEDWSLSWKKHWQPDAVGNRMLILPAWLEVPENYSDRVILRLDPGCAFGTGSHPTTRLCLEALEEDSPRDLRVADLGCGSGILGLAALGFGAKEVLAVDTDSLAVRSTIENARLNKWDESRLLVQLGSLEALESLLKDDPADLLLCNILASVIERLAPSFGHLVTSNGQAILSGLLIEQVPRLSDLLESLGWLVEPVVAKAGWGLLHIRRGPSK